MTARQSDLLTRSAEPIVVPVSVVMNIPEGMVAAPPTPTVTVTTPPTPLRTRRFERDADGLITVVHEEAS